MPFRIDPKKPFDDEIRRAGLDEAQARPAAAAVLAEFDRLHRQFHAWQPSELSARNTAESTGGWNCICWTDFAEAFTENIFRRSWFPSSVRKDGSQIRKN